MTYTINSLREALFQDINNVYETFKNFYGEDYVDLQYGTSFSLESFLVDSSVSIDRDISNELLSTLKDRLNPYEPFIMVYWPSVTVTNENDKSIVIQELYAKIPITGKGTIPLTSKGFYLNRSRYSKSQFLSGYLHSHIQKIPKEDYTQFQPPCLGSGPINRTIVSLKADSDTVTWLLFCQELALYVTVESLQGVPWKHLEQVGLSTTSYAYYRNINSWENIRAEDTNLIKYFVPYYLKHGKIIFDYRDDTYILGMSLFDVIIDMSNCFIDFYNDSPYRNEANTSYLFRKEILQEVLIKGNTFYRPSSTSANTIFSDRGKFVCNFKGNPVHLKIDDEGEEESITSIVLSNAVVNCIINNILKVINYRYGNTNTESSSTSENVLYL